MTNNIFTFDINKSYNDQDNKKIERYLEENSHTKKCTNKYIYPWTKSRIEDELLLNLSTYNESYQFDHKYNTEIVKENSYAIVIIRPYQEQAKRLLYLINLSSSKLFFTIHEAHLHPKLRKELFQLKKIDEISYMEIVTNAIKGFYEAADYEYFYLNGIGAKVFWKII